MVISSGDYYQTNDRGSPLQIEVVMHEPDNLKRCYFLVLARNIEDSAIFIRTFYYTKKMTRSKFKRATMLYNQSGFQFFKK